MSNATENLKHLLRQDLKDLEALSQILNEEKDLLGTRNSDAIQLITKNKSALVQQIEGRAKQKAKLLASSGLGIKPGAVTQTLERLGDTELSELWKQSLEALKSCKDQNSVNGSIVSHTLQRTAKLMSIIRGQGNQTNLYGQKGKAKSMQGGNHILGKA